ncbi:MAG TPA: alpha/beta fold hydrolase [Methanothermobacter sp.]|jgi:homoserine O-acetyltransferase|uniref:Homoserine O-acetyltransferase n=1 Tax=Methanothermobacter tenebrarum TaxID=680118 RepID=A0ABM7YET2_9EURY|nr:alpha/beta fold hydrolase [Methanothermobacter tenebrarum]MDX9693028.1 alpha/beta fold hydrolase [Methanothermobacter sp.]BDH79837.1 homoserine O-acetyltransferase [Methanothermobacter tenebrarum]HHW16739.1 alpha/beta fold hydrolase [Methanothermobacter sp.]HOQ19863.1 alpha/beta fold hydrolase [Methanothermobacter sp.]
MIRASYFTLPEFTFESGETLKKPRIEYTCIGTPKVDPDGFITNGLLHIHGWSGDYSSVKRLTPLIGEGKPLDDFFIIAPTSLGSPGSSSPSTSGLGAEFPQYTIKDMVNFHHEFIRRKFKIRKLKGVIGASMGGFQALQWGVSYPDFMDFLVLLVTTFKVRGINYAIFKYMNKLIKADPAYKGGRYEENPPIGTCLASMFMYFYGFSREYYNSLDNTELQASMIKAGKEGMELDANDIIWRNNAAMGFDLEDQLENIRADTLVVGIKEDQYFPPSTDTIPLSEKIKNSKLVVYESTCGHLGVNELEKIQGELKRFIGSPHY